jgi:hypothetical protein
MTNQTTYEIYHRDKNAYLSNFKVMRKNKMENLNIAIPGSMPFHPFDMGNLFLFLSCIGVIENFKMVYKNKIEQ